MARTDGKKENRGGARPNTGPKRLPLSVRQIQEMRAAAEERAREEKKSIFDVLLDFIYGGDDVNPRDKLAATKLYLDKMLISVSEGGEADRAAGPQVFLPEQRPQLEVVKSEKPEDKAA